MHPYIHLFGISFPSYGAMMMLGILVCGAIGCVRTSRAGLHWEDALIIGACAIGFALTGAALLHLFVTYPLDQIIQLLTTFRAPEGMVFGLVFYGGLLGAIPGVFLGARICKTPAGQFIIPLLPLVPIGHAFGRVGCFLAGCCYGRPTNHPIGVVYTNPITDVPTDVALLPVQLFEAAALLLIAGVLLFLAARRMRPVILIGSYALMYGLCRFVLESFRYDAVRGIYWGLSTSQWISIGLLVTAGVLFAKVLLERRRIA